MLRHSSDIRCFPTERGERSPVALLRHFVLGFQFQASIHCYCVSCTFAPCRLSCADLCFTIVAARTAQPLVCPSQLFLRLCNATFRFFKLQELRAQFLCLQLSTASGFTGGCRDSTPRLHRFNMHTARKRLAHSQICIDELSFVNNNRKNHCQLSPDSARLLACLYWTLLSLTADGAKCPKSLAVRAVGCPSCVTTLCK